MVDGESVNTGREAADFGEQQQHQQTQQQQQVPQQASQQQQELPYSTKNPTETVQDQSLVESLREEVEQLKSMLKDKKAADDDEDIRINYFSQYNSLSLKRSSHEDHKPLCPVTLHKRDHYVAFFVCYLFLAFKISSDKREYPHMSKWIKLLDLEHDDKQLKEFVNDIVRDRPMVKTLHVMGTSLDKESLVEEIVSILPDFNVTHCYLKVFLQNLWIYRPFLDRDTFLLTINRIIVKDERSPKRLRLVLTERDDIAVMSMFIILLRYTYVFVKVMDANKITDEDYLTILRHPTGAMVLATAYRCLSEYNIFRKSTLTTLQALVYLKCYYRDSPEDCDGMGLFKSQNLFGVILQSALQMGLNRDPSFFNQIRDNVAECNLRRCIWHHLTAIDAYTCVVSGSLPIVPDQSFVDVQFPLMDSIDELAHFQRDMIIRATTIHRLYLKISKCVNNVKEFTSLNELTRLLEESREYADSALSIESMVVLTSSNEKYGKRLNGYCLTIQLIQAMVEAQVSFLTGLHFESNRYVDIPRYLKYCTLTIGSICKVMDLSCAYLTGEFDDRVPQECNFETMPVIISGFERALITCIAMLLRFYQLREVLTSKNGTNGLTVDYVDCQINRVIVVFDLILDLVKNKLATKYYSALKFLSFFKYAGIILRTHKFNAMLKIVRFLESNEKDGLDGDVKISQSKREDIRKGFQRVHSLINQNTEWMQVSSFGKRSSSTKEKDTVHIVNFNNSNLMLDMNKDQFQYICDAFIQFKYSSYLKEKVANGEVDSMAHMTAPVVPTEDEVERLVSSNDSGDLIDPFNQLELFLMDDDLFDQMMGEYQS